MSSNFVVPSIQELQNTLAKTPMDVSVATSVARTLFHRIVIDNLLTPIFTSAAAVANLLQIALSCPDQLFSFDLTGLTPALPTMYVYTRTGATGRLGSRRPRYFERHIASLHEYQAFVEEHVHKDGTPASARQLMWIVVEDADKLDPQLRQILQDSGIKHIYLAHGPTQ